MFAVHENFHGQTFDGDPRPFARWQGTGIQRRSSNIFSHLSPPLRDYSHYSNSGVSYTPKSHLYWNKKKSVVSLEVNFTGLLF
jgi:hypothetical protein